MALLLTLAAMAMSPSIPNQVDIADADWMAYPRLQTEPDMAIPSGDMVERVQRMLAQRECVIEGQSAHRFDLDVNYAVMLDSQGNATRIMVQDVGCRPLELYVGRIVGRIVYQGFVRSPPPQQPSWYASRINFNLH